MAERKVTVVNPAGYQEQLPDTDHLLIAATPTANTHAVNKLFVDTAIGGLPISDIEGDISQLEADVNGLQSDVAQNASDIATKANKAYVDTQDNSLQTNIDLEASTRAAADTAEEAARIAADLILQNQIDAITETQDLQSVTDFGNSTTNDITSTGTITADALVGDLDYGEY